MRVPLKTGIMARPKRRLKPPRYRKPRSWDRVQFDPTIKNIEITKKEMDAKADKYLEEQGIKRFISKGVANMEYGRARRAFLSEHRVKEQNPRERKAHLLSILRNTMSGTSQGGHRNKARVKENKRYTMKLIRSELAYVTESWRSTDKRGHTVTHKVDPKTMYACLWPKPQTETERKEKKPREYKLYFKRYPKTNDEILEELRMEQEIDWARSPVRSPQQPARQASPKSPLHGKSVMEDLAGLHRGGRLFETETGVG